MKFVTKNFLVKEMGFTKTELDYLESKCQGLVYIVNGKSRYNIELVVELVKKDEIKKELGLGTSREIHDIAVKRNLVPSTSEDSFKMVSDLLGKYNKTEKFGVNTTFNHSQTTSRHVNHRLYRIEKSLNFLKDFYSEKVEPKKAKEVPQVKVEVKEVKTNFYTSCEVDALISMVGKEIDEVRSNYGARISMLERQIVKLNSKISDLEEQTKDNKSRENGWRYMTPDELVKAEYLVSNMNKLTNLSQPQFSCVESFKKQLQDSNGNKVWVGPRGLGILDDYYNYLTKNDAHVNGGYN